MAEKACQLIPIKSTQTSTFRIFSIGCGDGRFDIKILETIIDRFPDLKIQYIGTDIDEKFCQEARELLGALENVEVEILVLDFEQMDLSNVKVPPCDLVLAVHIFYYIRDINKALSVAQSLRKPDGMKRKVRPVEIYSLSRVHVGILTGSLVPRRSRKRRNAWYTMFLHAH